MAPAPARHVAMAGTLTEEALAGLAQRREEDEEFARKFAEDWIATGKFRESEGGGVERIGGEENREEFQGKEVAAKPKPKPLKLITEVDPGSVGAGPQLIMGTGAEIEEHEFAWKEPYRIWCAYCVFWGGRYRADALA